MKIKDIRMRCVKDLLLFFSRSTAFSTPELFPFAHDGAKGLGSRKAVPQTKWNEENMFGGRWVFRLHVYSERYNESLESIERVQSKRVQCCL